jgi:hypothetical protein
MRKPVLLLSILFSLNALAIGGGTVGNGGDVVVCKDKVMMLDTYEASTLRNYKTDLGALTDSIEAKIKLAVKRLAKVDPYRTAVIAYLASEFMNDTKFVSGVKLRDVKDSEEIFLPEGCVIEQIAIQNIKVVNRDPFYIVNADLWDRMDNDNKAILILHEAIFRAAQGAWPSPTVRLLNSMAFSTQLDQMTPLEYYEFVHGTVLKDTPNGAHGKDGRWYFQLPNAPTLFDSFITPVIWDRKSAQMHWSYMCRMKYAGVEATEADLAEISNIIVGHYDWGNPKKVEQRTVFVRDNGQDRAFDINYRGDKKLNTDRNVQGEVWCVSEWFPYEGWWK